MIKLLDHEYPKISYYALKCLGNIFNHEDSTYGEVILELGFMKIVINLFDSSRKIVKEVLWILSNIANATEKMFLQIIEEKEILNKILDIRDKTNEHGIVKETILLLHSIVHKGDPDIIKYLIDHQLFEFIISHLQNHYQPSIIVYFLKCLYKIFQRGSDLDKNENLFAHQFSMLDGEEILNAVHQKYGSNSEINLLHIIITDKYFKENDTL